MSNDSFFLVQADGPPRPPAWFGEHKVPKRLHLLSEGAAEYVPDGKLVTAVNVALAIGAPLLLTGAPGTGKTQLAHWLAWKLSAHDLPPRRGRTDTPTDLDPAAWKQPFTFHTKSTSTWRDLLYSFDTVRYFHDGMDRTRAERGEAAVQPVDYVTPGVLWRALATMHEGLPAVLLIDEIDKAPRDFPNDLLHELDQFRFVVPELQNREIAGPEDKRPPVVVITSNDERKLPGPFLRRCVVHHLALDERVVRAAVARWREHDLTGLSDRTVDRAIGILMKLQSEKLSRKPATAELLAWLTAIDREHGDPVHGDRAPLDNPDDLPAVGALIKDEEDRKQLGKLLG
jgi:MoxR-like ATPase